MRMAPALAATASAVLLHAVAFDTCGDCRGEFVRADRARPLSHGRGRLRRLPHGSQRQTVRRRARSQTPFGTIYSTNITPDRETGIGAWTNDEFYRAMHEGIAKDDVHLYPAFPYPYYTHVTREDVDFIRAYLATLPPVSNRPPRNELPFPLDQRIVMRPWNWMFFEDSDFKPSPDKSAAWNRGAYLVEGLGHCGACHTPKNFLGADETKKGLQGSSLQNWFAPSLGSDLRAGLGGWSSADIVEYLKTGRNAHYNATGPMAEVVTYSTSKLSNEDLTAIATYLKDLPGAKTGQTANSQSASSNAPNNGAAIYGDSCSACHRMSGEGIEHMFPTLKGSSSVQQSDPTTIIRVILQGARTVPTDARPTPSSMPAYGWKLNDAQVAAVASYVRNAWGNVAPPVTADQVRNLRDKVGSAE